MKKIFLLFFILGIGMLSGCRFSSQSSAVPSLKNSATINGSSYDFTLLSVHYPSTYTAQENYGMVTVSSPKGKIIIGGFIPSVGHPEADENDIIFQKISYTEDPKSVPDAIPAALYFRTNDGTTEKELMDILQTVKYREPKISTLTLPSDIHPLQIRKVVNDQYALVEKSSFNIYIPNLPPGFQANYSGVLQWNQEKGQWEKFLQIEDTNTKISSKNNPVDMWWEGADGTDKVPHLQVVDTNGGGSGEGVAKVLVPTNLGMDEWKVEDCFDYAYDLGNGKKRVVSSPECQAVKVKVPLSVGNVGSACQEDSDCVTPMDYLVRSVCPYHSLCIENTCKVVCTRILLSDEDPNHPKDSTPYVSPVATCKNNRECSQLCVQRKEIYGKEGVCIEGSCHCITATK